VPRTKSPARLIIALSVAGMLAIFLVYFAITGGTPQVEPSQLAAHGSHNVVLVGSVVAGSIKPDADNGVSFRIQDRAGSTGTAVPVVYHATPPDAFKGGREISLHGALRDGVFVGDAGSMMTKCPSKYQAAKKAA
jgi:cytochrome c-type biogenesis protein CcmE